MAGRELQPPFLPSCLGLVLPPPRPRNEPPRTSGFGFERAATIMAANLDAAFEWFSVSTLAPESPVGEPPEESPATLGSIAQLVEHLEDKSDPAL